MSSEKMRQSQRVRALNMAVAAVVATAVPAWAVNMDTDNFIGAGSPNNQWLVPANWSLGVVPNDTVTDDYLVSIPTNTTVQLQSVPPNPTPSLDTVFDLNLGGNSTLNLFLPLSVADAINGSGATINVLGTTLSLAAQTNTAANPANIFVQTGGSAVLGYTTLTFNNSGSELSADGSGSSLNLSSTTALNYGVPNNGNNFQYTIAATDGATVNLSGLTAISRLSQFDTLNFNTSAGGTINLNALQTINVDNQPSANNGTDTHFNGASFSMPALTAARFTLFDLTFGTSISAPKLTDIDNSQVEIASGGTFTTGSISDIDNASISVTAGATFGQGINPISATSLTLNNGGQTISADGTGSILNLSTVQTLNYGIPNNGSNFQYTFSATDGASLNLSGLTSIVRLSQFDTLNFNAAATGTINLNGLQSINVDGEPGANNGTDTHFNGSFSLPALTTARYTLFNAAFGTSLSAPKLIDIDNSEVEVASGGTFTTGSISDIDNATILITAGGTFGQGINPISATSLTLNNGGDTISADGTGSILNLSSVQTLSYGIPGNGTNFQYNLSAMDGASLNLAGLTSIVRLSQFDTLNFNTANAGTINLSGLKTINVDGQPGANNGTNTHFNGTSFSLPALTTARFTLFDPGFGATFSAPKLADIDNSEVEIAGGSTFTTGSIADIDNATILVTAGATFGQGINPISATSLTLNNGGDTISADGTGSILNLSSVQTLNYGVPNNGTNFQYLISATDAASLNLSGLTSIVRLSQFDTLNFTNAASGTINLNGLQSINVDNQLGANNGTDTQFNGSFSLPALTTARFTLFNAAFGTSLNAPKLIDIDNSEVEVAKGGTFTTGSISDIDNATIFVTAGGTFGQGINPISATSITLNNGGDTLSADGSGSILNLSSVQTVNYGIPNNGTNFQYTVSASNGATVNLSGLTSILRLSQFDTLNFNTSGGGTINLNGLQSINVDTAPGAANGPDTHFNGASFSLPALTIARFTLFNSAFGTSISAPKLTDIDTSEILAAGGGTFTTGSISDIDNASIFVTAGGSFGQGANPISATSVTINDGGDNFSADGTGSILNLSSVQTLAYGIPNNGDNFLYNVSATNGGAVNLSSLTSVSRLAQFQTVTFNAAGGGTINLSSLQSVNVDNQPPANTGTDTVFKAGTGGAITIGSARVGATLPTRYTAFDVTDSGGKLTFQSSLTLGSGSSINIASGAVVQAEGNFINTLNAPAAFQASSATFDLNGLGVQTLEAAGTDAGAVNPANNGNFGFGQLDIGSSANAFPTEVDLVDNFNNGDRGSSGTTPEALYLFGEGSQNGLVLNNGSVLVIGSLNVYEMQNGSFLSLQSLIPVGQTIVPFTMNGSNGFIAKNLSTLQDSWINAGSGSWSTASNWSLGTVPSDLNDVLITTPASLTVSGPTTTTRVRSLNVNGPAAGPVTTLNLPGPASFAVNTTLQTGAKGQINLQGGTLSAVQFTNQGGFVQSAGSTFNAGAITNSGTFTMAGTLAVTQALTNSGQFSQTAGTASFLQILGGGSLSISGGSAALAPNVGLSTVGSLSVTGTGKLDVTNNSLVINYTGASPVAGIQTALASGYSHGAWTGPGINSSTAAAGPTGKFAVGYADGNTDKGTTAAANQILIEFTLAGDATLDGSVGFSDLVVVAQNFGLTGKDWSQGNFNYDPTGSIGFTDVVAVAQNFGNAVPVVTDTGGALQLSPAWQSAGVSVQATSVVPEPATLGFAGIAAAGLLARRRRRSMR